MLKFYSYFSLIILIIANQLYSQECCSLAPATVFASGGEAPFFPAISPNGRCLAVANVLSGTVTSFSVDPSTCQLAQASTVATEDPLNPASFPTYLAFSLDGSCLVVSNSESGTVTSFTVNATTCELTRVSVVQTDPLNPSSGPQYLEFSSTGCLAVANMNGRSVTSFTLNPLTCELTRVSVVPIDPTAIFAFPQFLAFSPDGSCIAVPNGTLGRVTTLSVNPATCALTFVNVFETDPSPTFLEEALFPAFSPDGRCLAVTNRGVGTVASFSVDPDTCNLTRVSVIPSDPTTNSLVRFLAFSLDGQCLVATNPVTNSVTSFNVNPGTCELTRIQVISTDPSAAITTPIFLRFSSRGCLAVANQNGNSVSSFNLDPATCLLTPVSVRPTDPAGINLPHPSFLTYSPDGQCLFVANQDSNTIASLSPDNPSLTINASPSTSICSGSTLTLIAQAVGGSGTYTSFSWTGPNGFASDQQIVVIPNAAGGTYTVTVTDSNGCQGTNSVDITVNENPTVNIAPPFLFICTGQTIELTANPSGGSGSYASFAWSGPNGFFSNQQTIIIPNATSANVGTYTVTVTDSNGCQGATQAQVFLITIQVKNEIFSTCVNQKLNVLPPGVLTNANFALIPQITTSELQVIAREVIDPMLKLATAELVLGPSFGTLIFSKDGAFNYMPAYNFAGQDSFVFKAILNGECNSSNMGTVTIYVTQCCSIN